MTSQELASYFKESVCNFDLKATTKRDVLAEMVDAICTEHNIKDRDIILEMLLNRESLGSTAIAQGVAFPHGRTLAVRDLSIVFARSVQGVDFEAVDKEPTHLFFLIIAPPQDKDNLYLQVLGQMVNLIKEKATRSALLAAGSFEELQNLMGSETG
ncbi:MAG: PTS sugar transporter subunit IIA [Candidatus Krumholzibacteriota bacterium]|nr:PTS sugar transporter subunit IIA [Candidatus Krumholzibacteriota bacterium]